MIVTIIISLAVCLLGAFVFLATDKKAAQLGLYAFAVGLLVLLLQVRGEIILHGESTPPAAHSR